MGIIVVEFVIAVQVQVLFVGLGNSGIAGRGGSWSRHGVLGRGRYGSMAWWISLD